MLEDKEDSSFKGLKDDSPRLTGCGACIPELTTRRILGRLCLGSRAQASTLTGRHRFSVVDSAFRRFFVELLSLRTQQKWYHNL